MPLSSSSTIGNAIGLIEITATPTRTRGTVTKMAPSDTVRKARLYIPLAALAISLTTLFSCVIIAKTSNVYLGGLWWPFFSTTGRDKPAYYVFCAGLTTTAVLLIATWTFNYQFQHAVLIKATHYGIQTQKHQRMAAITCFAGIISVFGLSLLAFFDTATYKKTHQISAYWFFGWKVVATIMNTFVSKRIYNLALTADNTSVSNYTLIEANAKPIDAGNPEQAHKRRRTHRIQLSLNLIFLVAFIIYIPWNIISPANCPLLTVDECLERDLGEQYCSVTMREDEVNTMLSNCEANPTKPQIRALAQLTCVLTIIGYCVTFITHDYEDAERDDAKALQSAEATALA